METYIYKPLQKLIPLGLITLSGLLLTNLAFSDRVRKNILNRDRHCVDEGDGACYGGLEAAHENHIRDDNYNLESNGKARCVRHHYIQHFAARDDPRCIGMTKQGNASAIRHLKNKLAGAVLFSSNSELSIDGNIVDLNDIFEP